MNKTRKELAFLRDLTVDALWTARFTDIFDKNHKFTREHSIVYLNAGTGSHALALRERIHRDTTMSAISEDKLLAAIASAKGSALKANVAFSHSIECGRFDLAVADASLLEPDRLNDLLAKAVALSEGRVVFFLPTAGSFGEIFSLLWEVCLIEGLIAKSGKVENLIKSIPTVSKVEEMARNVGLTEVKAYVSDEIFEFADGSEFIESSLISDFLLPIWLRFLEPKERKTVRKRLARTIDQTRDNMSFRFTVKAAMFAGRKV